MRIFTPQTTRRKLLAYTKRVLKNQRPVVIIVTGSMGKTTTHAAVAEVVSAKYRTKIITTNDNNGRGPLLGFFGMSLPQKANSKKFWAKALIRAYKMSIKFPYDAVILEISDSAYDSLKDFLKLICADYCIVTGVAKVHMKKFETEERLIEDIQNIARTAKKVIYNTDFAQLKEIFGTTGAISYGTSKADFTFSTKRNNLGLLINKITFKNNDWINYQSKFIAMHALYSQTAAAAVGKELNISNQQITNKLGRMTPLKGRLNVFRGINDSTIIDDTYNANADSMIAAVKLLGEFDTHTIAVLGSINELGTFVKNEHARVGKTIAKYPDEVYVFGDTAKKYLVPSLLAAGFNKDNLKTFETSRQVGAYLKKHLTNGSVVIAKGSQNDVFTEEAIKPLLLEKSDISKLVRQSDFWMQAKEKSFTAQEANQ